MAELSLEYWRDLSSQIILISSLLSGFSITVIANILVYDKNHRIAIYLLKIATVAAGSFLVAVFSMTNILMKSTSGYPLKASSSEIILPRIIGIVAFGIGIISLSAMISLSGWTKSTKTGIFTTCVGIITFILIVLMLAS